MIRFLHVHILCSPSAILFSMRAAHGTEPHDLRCVPTSTEAVSSTFILVLNILCNPRLDADLHGSWNEKTGVNSPLYDQEDSPELSVHGCVNNWLEGGAPREKINIGWAVRAHESFAYAFISYAHHYLLVLPSTQFYGRSFLGAQGLHESHEGNDDSTWWADEGVPQCELACAVL